MSLAYRLVSLASRPLVRLLFRPRVRGAEHTPSSGFVLSANHLSGFDMWALGYALPERWLRHMAKPQLFERLLIGRFVRMAGAFPAHEGAVEAAAELARAGHVVVVMPEGARRRPDRVHRPRKGAARAALRAHVPLVPAAIRGTDHARALEHWEVVFGPPIALDDVREDDVDDAATVATERLWAAIRELEAGLGQSEDRAASSRSSAT